ncbi:MAG: hypothetical protein H7Z71_04455 [Moraxellaceae bacterium]|nr:hypothetical protein [Pseudobdellovibrionaceae bacterium]
MNNLLRPLVIIATTIICNLSMADNLPKKIPSQFNKIYAPGGFDSNDHVQIVGEGVFHNSCFRQAETIIQIDNVKKQVSVFPVAYEYPGICLQFMVPFQHVVDIGILEAGNWEILQGTLHTKIGSVQIRKSVSDAADDFLYAPVSQAFFYKNNSTGQVNVTGEFTNDCLSIDEIKVTIEANVIAIQPIAKMSTDKICTEGLFPFSKTVSLGPVPAGKYLLHVRTLNGNAINSIVTAE